MKRYIPPRQRRAWQRVRISTAGLTITTFIFLAFISLVSLFQASLIPNSAQAQTSQIEAENVISDEVVAAKATSIQTSNQPARRISVANVDLSNLPVERKWPIQGRRTTNYSSRHPAIDLAAPRGTPIHPFASGIVVSSGWMGSFGRALVIRHNDGWETTYAHMNSLAVGVGQQIDVNIVIGTVGSTGYSTGPHLHFQVTQNGRYVNPLAVLP